MLLPFGAGREFADSHRFDWRNEWPFRKNCGLPSELLAQNDIGSAGGIVAGLPYGFWSAEAYDAVRVMAKAINDCGETADDVKRCLYQVKDYPGVSAPVSIDQNGDGVRQYVLKRVTGGKVVTISKG